MGDALALNVQESTEEERKVVQPLVYFLRGGMGDYTVAETQSRRWWTTSFKDRLGCFGAVWRLTRPTMSALDDEDDHDAADQQSEEAPLRPRDPICVSLATALAAERELRALQQPRREEMKETLLLVEEAGEVAAEVEESGGGGGCCCVCMERKKGAAFIPCGHTFCRTCATEVRVGRGSCPLCNRRILDVLNIF